MDIRSFFQYLQFEKRYSKLTIAAYENDLLQFSKFLKETYEIDNFNATKHTYVRSWMVALMEAGIGTRSINRKLSSLKSYFKFSLKTGAIDHNPMLKVMSPKLSKPFVNGFQQKVITVKAIAGIYPKESDCLIMATL